MDSAYILNRGLPRHFAQQIEAYKLSLLDYSINYRSESVRIAERLAVFIYNNGGSTFSSFDNEMACNWLSEISHRELHNLTIYNNLKKGSKFVDFLIGQNLLTINILKSSLRGKRPSHLKDYRDYSGFFKGVENLYHLLTHSDNPKHLNDLVIISLLVTTPLKLKQIIEVKVSEMYLNRRKVVANGKEIVIPIETNLILSEYNKVTKRTHTQYFIIGKGGRGISYDWLKEKTFEKWSFFASSKINGQILKAYYYKVYKSSQHLAIKEL